MAKVEFKRLGAFMMSVRNDIQRALFYLQRAAKLGNIGQKGSDT